MKYLKKFNEDHNFTSVSAQELEDDLKQEKPEELSKISVSELEEILADYEKRLDIDVNPLSLGQQKYLSLPAVESVTKDLGQLKKEHPYITTEEPYKKIWWDFLKNKWHKKMKETEK